MEDKKAFLLKPDADGSCVWDHVTDLLVTIMDSRPADAVDSFELMSAQAKLPKAEPDFVPPAATVARARELADMLVPPAPAPNEEGEVVEPELNTEVDIHEFDTAQFEKAGVGLGEAESYRIAIAVKTLAESVEANLDTVRFWGKVFGSGADYLVAECTPKEVGEAAEQTDEEKKAKVVAPEAPGTGANAFVYYVCAQPGSRWAKLPDVRPEHIMGARAIKKCLTGDLSTKIEGYPVFPGSEAEYLRAQIARIALDTTIAPKGFFEMPGGEEYDPEEDPDAEPAEAEEYEAPSDFLDLVHPSNWVHRTRGLLKTQGRCSWFEFEEEEVEEDDEAPPPVKAEPEKPLAHLSALSADAKIGAVPAWTFRVCSSALPSSQVAVAKSQRWPGALTVASFGAAKGVQWSTVYFGDGQKFSTAPYSPPMPPSVEEEFDDSEMMEQQDPTPEEEAEAAAAAAAPEEEE